MNNLLSPFANWCCRTGINVGTLNSQFADSKDIYQAMCWIVNYLEHEVIPKVNEDVEGYNNLYAKYVEIKSFVEHYFENLDVQQEINNKLNQMAEDGTLQEIIGAYLNANAVWGFDTVADMKAATNLVNGSFARTLGYHAKNDGGSALYKIRSITNDDIVDESFIIEIGDEENNLIAELILENSEINANALGADNTGLTDASAKINLGLRKINELWLNSSEVNTLVLEGCYLVNNQIEVPASAKIKGSGFVKIMSNVIGTSTVFIHYLDEQRPLDFNSKTRFMNGDIINFESGCEIVHNTSKDTNNAIAIEIGERSDLGTNYTIARYNIKNLTINNFDTGLMFNSYNVYIGNHENLHIENVKTAIKFGLLSQKSDAANIGERMTFVNCTLADAYDAVLYSSINWNTFFTDCSFDFDVNVFRQEDRTNIWNFTNCVNCHFEGFYTLAKSYGQSHSMINISNSMVYNSHLTNTLLDDVHTGVMIRDSSLQCAYDETEVDPEKYVLVGQKVILDNSKTIRNIQFNQFFWDNNLVKNYDGIADGSVSLNQSTFVGDFKVAQRYGLNESASIVTDNYLYNGHKSLVVTKTADSSNPILDIETKLLPVNGARMIEVGIITYNAKSVEQACQIFFYDIDGNRIQNVTTGGTNLTTVPEANKWYINPRGRYAVVPSNAVSYKLYASFRAPQADPANTQYKIGGIVANTR